MKLSKVTINPIRNCRLIFSVLFIFIFVTDTSVHAYESYKFDVEQPKIVIYPNEYLNPSRNHNTRLFALARQMQKKTKSDIIDFVRITLAGISEVYQQEAMRARQASIEDEENRDKLLRWSRNSLLFAYDLNALRERINLSTRIEFYYESYGELSIHINNKPLLVTSPVLTQQIALEKKIIDETCRVISCDMVLIDQQTASTKRSIWVYASWQINQDNTKVLKTKNGLNFVFSNLKNKKRKQQVCLKIARDLNFIAETLMHVKKKGLLIDWGYMYLNVIPGRNEYELIINQFKDAIHLSLEAIQYLNDFPQVTIPWLQARIEQAHYEFYFYDAEKLIKEVSL